MITRLANWTPVLGLLALAVASFAKGPAVLVLATLALVASVIVAVHHAEVVAHRTGEPYGTLVLALAITGVETALIVSLMLAGGPGSAELPRDAIFAAIMIICSGVLGICLFSGGIRHREQFFRVEGAVSALAALVTLSVLSLIVPSFTTTTSGGTYSTGQLIAVAGLSLFLWGVFVAVQTGRHRDYFLPVAGDRVAHSEPPSVRQAWISFVALLASVVAVVGLAKTLSKPLERLIERVGAPAPVIGIVIALLVLLPETGAAIRAARANRFQTSMNLALGSALASIGLTIPAVAVASFALGVPLELGLEPKNAILLTLTFSVNTITLALGRSNILLGAVHLVLFATFLLFAFIP